LEAVGRTFEKLSKFVYRLIYPLRFPGGRLAVENSRERLGMRLPVPEQALKTGRKISSLSLETLEKMSGTTAVSAKVGSTNVLVTLRSPEMVTCVRSLRVRERNNTLE